MTVHFQRAPRDLFHLEMLFAGFWIARRGFVTVSLAR